MIKLIVRFQGFSYSQMSSQYAKVFSYRFLYTPSQTETNQIEHTLIANPEINKSINFLPNQAHCSNQLERFNPEFDIQLDGLNERFEPAALDLFKPAPRPAFNLAAFINHSPTLQQLIHLGIQLHKLEKDRDVAQYLLTLDFDRDVLPHVRFLRKLGLKMSDVGPCLTSNIQLLKQSIDNLKVRIEYLRRKQFSKREIAEIVNRYPNYLNVSIVDVDEHLGFYQSQLTLTQSEVRHMLIRFPRMVVLHPMHLSEIMFALTEQMGFHKALAKQILIQRPGLMRRSKYT